MDHVALTTMADRKIMIIIIIITTTIIMIIINRGNGRCRRCGKEYMNMQILSQCGAL